MKIALVAAPFIAVPPADYGGTELFVAHLAEGLRDSGVQVVVYANGESTVNVERRWMYEHSQWPIKVPEHAWIRELNHESWAFRDAEKDCDVVHVQSASALPSLALSTVPWFSHCTAPTMPSSASSTRIIQRPTMYASVMHSVSRSRCHECGRFITASIPANTIS